MRAIILSLLVTIAAMTPVTRAAMAQDELKIVAVVNEDVITEFDLFMRMRLAMLSTKLNDTPENRERLVPTLLRTMIDERLKLQEAKNMGVRVEDSEIERRIGEIAKRNGFSKEEFGQVLAKSGILLEVLAEQLRAEISWARLVQRQLRSRVKITDEEIDQALASMQAAQGQTEFRLSQIFLATGSADDEAAVRMSASRLKEQLVQGAEFSALASEFSQDQGAIRGGDWGWVRLDMLDPQVAEVVRSLQPGQVGGPIRAAGGYYIVSVRNTRIIDARAVSAGTVELQQFLWSMPKNAAETEVDKAISQANTLAPRIQSCADMADLANDAAPGAFRALGSVPVDDLPQEIQSYALNQPIGQPTPAVRTDRGVGLYVVCSRSGGDEQALSRVGVADRLGRQRLETLARGYLSDLRRAALIDIRL